MKPRTLLFISLLSLCSIEIIAQRQQITEFYHPPTDIPMEGKMTYSYIVDKDGENLKDGPLSISANIENVSRYINFRKMTLNGTYKLTANYSKGNMQGRLSLNSKITYLYAGESSVESFSLNGYFNNGIPHGTFVADYVTTIPSKMNVTFKNGKLVGPFFADYSTNLYDRTIYEGTLTQGGELAGRWSIKHLNSTDIYTFQNGVCISISGTNTSTPPALAAKARQYAAGNLSEEKLREQGFMVMEDSLNLGIAVNNILLRDNVIAYKDLRGCDFSTPNIKKYKYLIQTIFLTDEGVETLANSIQEVIENKKYNNDNFWEINASYNQYERIVATDEKGNVYVKPYTHNYHLTTAKKYNGKIYDRVYLTQKQVASLKERVSQIRKEYAIGLIDYLEVTEGYKFNDKFGKLKKVGEENMSIKDLSALYINIDNVCMDTLKTTPDGQYLLAISKPGMFYVKKEAVEELKGYKDKTIALIKEYYSKLYAGRITINYNATIFSSLNKLDAALKCFDYLVNKSSLSIAYDDSDKYFCTDGVENPEYWKLELKKNINKFTKITHIKITGIEGDILHCELTKKGKEVYATSITLKDNKLLVTSLNFEKAKLISEK